jgi:hypothetical protein
MIPDNHISTMTARLRGSRLTEKSSERSAVQESLLDIASVGTSVLARLPRELVDDVGERNAAEDEETPLVAALHKGTNKTSDDHDLINDNGEQNGRPWHSRGKEEIQKKQGSRDEPINVAHVVDGTVPSANFWVARAGELDSDRSETEVGAHGEVGDAGDENYGCGDVVEDAVAALLPESEANEAA